MSEKKMLHGRKIRNIEASIFWKNNHYVRVKITEDNQYIIHSMKKSHKRQYTYDEIIKEFILFADADAEEIGKAVI